MFRSLVRFLTPSRPRVQTRSQVQRFRPQLEVLEGRLAPSGLTGISIEHNHDVGVIVAQAATIAFSGGHNTINQVAIVGFGIGL